MPTVTNTTADLEGDTLVTTQDAQTITGLKTYSRGANTPFAVAAGSTKVANLDADLLDGLEAAAFAELSAAETITGLWTFSRGAAPPFAVNAGATMVANLDADKVDGYEAAAFAALSEAETITGAWTFNTAPKLANNVALNARNAANSADVALLKLTAGDVFEIGQASLAASLLGGQLKFPATQNASADANTIDDYEEGAFTPGISFGGASTGIAYTRQQGMYVKIGQFTWVNARVTLSNKGSSTTNARMTGLPFSSNAGNPGTGAISIPFYEAMASATGVQLLIEAGASSALFYIPAATQAGVAQDTNFTNTTDLQCAGGYRAAA